MDVQLPEHIARALINTKRNDGFRDMYVVIEHLSIPDKIMQKQMILRQKLGKLIGLVMRLVNLILAISKIY